MDSTAVLVLAIIAVIVIAAFLVFRQRSKVDISGPLGTRVKIDASNQPPPIDPAVRIERARSEAGGASGEDQTGRGVQMSDLDVHGDIRGTSTPPREPPPKA